MSHSVKRASGRPGVRFRYSTQRGELGVNADDDVARKDLRMAFGGMGLVILAALIATLLS